MLPFDPKKPLYGFKMRFPHAQRRIHLFTDNRFIYFRPKNAPTDWWGAILGEAVFLKRALSRADGKFYRFEKSVRVPIEEGSFLRVFHMSAPPNGEPEGWRIFWRPEIGVVIPVNHPQELNSACFAPQDTQRTISLWKTPTQILKNRFEREWRALDSDVHAALPWCNLMGQERKWQAVRWENGNRKDLENIVKAMLICAPIWQDQKRISVTYSWPCYGVDKSPIRIYLFKDVNNPNDERCNNLTVRIERTYRSHYDLPTGTRDDWLLPWTKHGKRNYFGGGDYRGGSQVWYQIDPPTQHERLEAALFLRDWLRENAPDLLSDWFPNSI